MLESLYNRVTNAHNIGRWEAAHYFNEEYRRIWDLLKTHLTKEQFEFISPLEKKNFSSYYNPHEKEKAQKACIMGAATACSISMAFLESLNMSLDKELANQKVEFRLKEKELELKEKEIEHMKKLLSKSLEAIKEFPELQRSKVMEDIKKSHREIEKNTNENTRSQKN